MKTVEAKDFAADVNRHLDQCQRDRIAITQSGKPCAVVHGVEYDCEPLELMNSPEFRAMIEERRRGPTIPWELAKKQLESKDQ
jgi:hypothetical protein